MKIFIKSVCAILIMTFCSSVIAQSGVTNNFRSKINIGFDFMPNMTVFKSPHFIGTTPLPNYNNHVFATGIIAKIIAGYKLSPKFSLQAGFLYSIANGRYVYESKVLSSASTIPLTTSDVSFYKIDHSSSEFITGVKYYFIKNETKFKPYIGLDLAYNFYYKWRRTYRDTNLTQDGNSASGKFNMGSKKFFITNLYLYSGCDILLSEKLSTNIDLCFSLGNTIYGAPSYIANLWGIGLGIKRKL